MNNDIQARVDSALKNAQLNLDKNGNEYYEIEDHDYKIIQAVLETVAELEGKKFSNPTVHRGEAHNRVIDNIFTAIEEKINDRS